jgi:D-tagatose-1,6-bisphosphate aldolase subunit GatZ/KbaZ
MANLSQIAIPQTLLSAFLPDQYRSVRNGSLKLDAHSIILHQIREVCVFRSMWAGDSIRCGPLIPV